MSKLVKLLVLLAIVAVAAYAVFTLSSGPDHGRPAASGDRDDRPRLEEKYGFTSETVGD